MIVSKQYNIPLLLSKFHLFWNSGTLNRISVQSTQKLIILNQIPFAQQIEEMSTFQFQFFLFIIALKVKDNSPLVKLF